MQVKICDGCLTVLKSSFTELEAKTFNDAVGCFPDDLAVNDNRYSCSVSGSKGKLFDLLLKLSFEFDIDLI